MEKLFYGDWTVEVLKDSGVSHRLIIHGSAANDGVYPVSGMAPISVSGVPGQGWYVTVDSLRPQPRGSSVEDWRPGSFSRRSVAYTIQEGLVVVLSSEPVDSFRTPLDGGVVLRCRNVDPKLNPWHPFANPYDFTLPERNIPPVPPPR